MGPLRQPDVRPRTGGVSLPQFRIARVREHLVHARPVITSPHKNRVSSPSPTSPTLPGRRPHLSTEDLPAKPRLVSSTRRAT